MLIEAEKKQVRYWIDLGCDLAACDSMNKDPSLERWGDNIKSQFDYGQRLDQGFYDKGVAIICGQLRRGPYKGKYIGGFDFDNEEAIKAFCEAGDFDLVRLASITRVEWHRNPGKIHVLFITNRPFKNLTAGKGLEVMGEKKLLFVSPSKHKDNNQYSALDNEQIMILDDIGQMRIESLIEIFMMENSSSSYMSKDGVSQYIKYLEQDDTVLNEGERHPAMKVLGTSYFFRYAGDWADMTDDQRFERLIAYNEKHCNPPKAYKEILDIWEWIKKTHTGRRQEERDKREDEKRTSLDDSRAEITPIIAAELEGNMWYKINDKPPRFIIADRKTKRLLEAAFKSSETTKKSAGGRGGGAELTIYKQVVHTKPYLTCMPNKAIIHKSPINSIINSGEKYTIYFIGAKKSGNRIIKHKTISEIAAELKESGNVLADFGVDIALSAILKDFERKKLLEENNDMGLTGFFIDDENKNIIASDMVTEQPTPAMVKDALDCVEEIKKYYEGRLDLLSTIIIWGMVAPISFLLKQNSSPFLNWLVLWGFTNATKSSTGDIVLAMDGHHNDSDFVLGAGSIDTIARLGDTISKTTFPKLVDEVNLDSISMKDVVENMKTAIESKICRTKFMGSKDRNGTRIPSLSPLILTSNFTPPIHNSAFMRRVIDRSFPQSESRVKADLESATEFEEFMRVNLDKLIGLGRFRNWFVMNNRDVILDKKISPLELGKKILSAAYEYVGIEMPEWFNERLPQKQLEESISDNQVRVKHAFVAYINTNFERALAFFRTNDPEMQGLRLPDQISGRLVRLVDNKLLPGITRDNKNNIIIYSGVLEEIYKFGATRDQIPNLKALADYICADYARIHPGNKVVKCTGKKLEDYFDKVVEIEGEVVEIRKA